MSDSPEDVTTSPMKTLEISHGEAPFRETLLSCTTEVVNELGLGLTEALYRNALAIALRQKGCEVSCEVVVPIIFQSETIGAMRADLIVDKIRVIELKVAAKITEGHLQQARAYLCRMPAGSTGHVINFGGSEETMIRHVSDVTSGCKRPR
jgi:GxxExxY protein